MSTKKKTAEKKPAAVAKRHRAGGLDLLRLRLERAGRALLAAEKQAAQWGQQELLERLASASRSQDETWAACKRLAQSGWTPPARSRGRAAFADGDMVTLTDRGQALYGPLFGADCPLRYVDAPTPGLARVTDGVETLPVPRACVRKAS